MDRFMWNQKANDVDYAHYMPKRGLNYAHKPKLNHFSNSPSRVAYRKGLGDAMNVSHHQRIPESKNDELISKKIIAPLADSKAAKPPRRIPTKCVRILDVPGIVDDYNLNLFDWGSTNVLAIALDRTLYLWDAISGKGSNLVTVDDESGPITSVKWSPHGGWLALGLNNSVVELWDMTENKRVRSLRGGHRSRVGSLAWNDLILTSGGMDGQIMNSDIRIKEQVVETYRGHTGEICGLNWSPSGRQLASGGDDNLLYIWNNLMTSSRVSMQWVHEMDKHAGPVKALAWSPIDNELLASGGGEGDHCIKLWNSRTGAQVNSVNTYSAVSGLLWNANNTNKRGMELLSCHGYTTNWLILRNFPEIKEGKADYRGHKSRILCMAQSPDGCTVASASADETLRFWNVFENRNGPSKCGARKLLSPLPFSDVSFIR